MNNAFKNWKTSLFGIIAILLTASGPVLNHYVPIVGLDWVSLNLSLSAIALGGGLLTAKDSTTHSTLTQVQTATVDAKIEGKP